MLTRPQCRTRSESQRRTRQCSRRRLEGRSIDRCGASRVRELRIDRSGLDPRIHPPNSDLYRWRAQADDFRVGRMAFVDFPPEVDAVVAYSFLNLVAVHVDARFI